MTWSKHCAESQTITVAGKHKKTSVKCQSCQAISVFDATRVGQRCDFCGSTSLVPYEQIKESFTPESLLPLKISESKVRALIRKWYGEVWFAPNKLRHAALTDQVKGVYLPYWTFDAQVYAEWTAEAGHYYYTTEQVRDNDGSLRTRQVRHVRWQPASGDLQHFFNDELVAASHAIESHHLRAIEPFPTNDLVAYNAGYLLGGPSNGIRLISFAAAQHSRERMDSQLREHVRRTGSGRYTSQLASSSRLFKADIQTYPRAGLVTDLQLRFTDVPCRCQRLHWCDLR